MGIINKVDFVWYHSDMTYKNAYEYLRLQRMGTIATLNKDGSPHTAMVYYTADDKGHIFMATMKDSQKAKNIADNAKVAMQIGQEENAKTLQLEGEAEIVTQVAEKVFVLSQIAQVANANPNVMNFPALMKFSAAHGMGIACIKVRIDTFKFSDFSGTDFQVIKGVGKDLVNA